MNGLHFGMEGNYGEVIDYKEKRVKILHKRYMNLRKKSPFLPPMVEEMFRATYVPPHFNQVKTKGKILYFYDFTETEKWV